MKQNQWGYISFLFVGLMALTPNSSYSQPACLDLFNHDLMPREDALKLINFNFHLKADKSTWEPVNFTNPRQHQTENYRYIIHGLNNHRMRRLIDNGAMTFEEYYKNNFNEDFLAFPQLTSLSLITSERPLGMFGYSALIVSVPKENLITTFPRDVGSPRFPVSETVSFTEMKNVLEKVKNSKDADIRTPSELASVTDGYNEIVAMTNRPGGKKLEVTGALLMTDSFGVPLLNEPYLGHFKKMVRERDLTLVNIPPQRGFIFHIKAEVDKTGWPKKILVPFSKEQYLLLFAERANTDLTAAKSLQGIFNPESYRGGPMHYTLFADRAVNIFGGGEIPLVFQD